MNRRCGTCVYGCLVDTQHVDCYGNPPTVVLMQGPPTPLSAGQPTVMAQKLRPKMGKDEQGCHLWEAKAAPAELPAHSPRAGGVIIR